jgi:hypothetical protein
MGYDCRILEAAAQPIAAIRVQVESGDVGAILAQLLPEVFTWLQAKGIEPAGRPFVRYFARPGSSARSERLPQTFERGI